MTPLTPNIGTLGFGRTPVAATARRASRSGETYDGIVLVGGFPKAYSSLLAFIACPIEVGFRIQLTAVNADDEVDRLVAALEELVERGELRSARDTAEALEVIA